MSFKVIDACALHSTTTRLTLIFNCSEFASVGDLVVTDIGSPESVIALADNDYAGLCIGQIIDKPTTITAEVLLTGVVTATVNDLAAGVPVFVGTDGKPTITPPTTDVLQIIGIGLSIDQYLVKPETNRVKRI